MDTVDPFSRFAGYLAGAVVGGFLSLLVTGRLLGGDAGAWEVAAAAGALGAVGVAGVGFALAALRHPARLLAAGLGSGLLVLVPFLSFISAAWR